MSAATASPAATQRNRHLELKTPLGTDALLITEFNGSEQISRIFEFEVRCMAPKEKEIDFDKLIGQPITVKFTYPNSKTNQTRFFNGICKAMSQSESDITYAHYRLDIVPKLWLLEHRVNSRIFQHINVPEILKKVLQGGDFKIDVKFDLKGTYEPRDYCVQYYETDYWFVSRLMEEEGIFFYFTHTDGGHQMVLGDHPGAHAEVVYDPKVTYKNVNQEQIHEQDLIHRLRKSQELTCGKVAMRDHSLELTKKNLEAQKEIQESVNVGKKTHKLKVADNGKLEIYQYPGEYAQRFDGVDRIGGDRAGDVQKIFQDNQRTASIRMQEEAVRAIELWGRSTCRQFATGHHFQLQTLASDETTKALKPDGKYVLTSVSHHATAQDDYASGGTRPFSYENKFTCIPFELPFRPGREKFKPRMPGCQTATVVGPGGEEIFVDKYGRVKVQFHWDREGKRDADSSCWIRVGTNWAGRNWGVFCIPRIGQEVIVDYLEGDPDRPIIVGNVWNNDQMPAYAQPEHKTRSWIKTNSSPGGVGFNEIRFEDKKGKEQIFIHGERNEDIRIKNDCMEAIMHDRHLIVGIEKDGKKSGKQHEEVLVDKHLVVHKDQEEHIGGNFKIHIGGIDGDGNVDIVIDKDKKELIKGNSHLHIEKDQFEVIDGEVHEHIKKDRFVVIDQTDSRHIKKDDVLTVDRNQHVHIKKDLSEGVDGHYAQKIGGNNFVNIGKNYGAKIGTSIRQMAGKDIKIEAGGRISLKAKKIVLEATAQISLKVGGNFVDISSSGVAIKGTMVLINSGGSAASAPVVSVPTPAKPTDAKDPKDAEDAKPAEPIKPTQADDDKTGHKSCD